MNYYYFRNSLAIHILDQEWEMEDSELEYHHCRGDPFPSILASSIRSV